ncbi:MAG: hypothetical protein U0798_06955 [Gemmataceae bacterium]
MGEAHGTWRVMVFGRGGAGKTDFSQACSLVDPSVQFIDTESQADERALATGTLPEPLLHADALAVTIDIAADEREVHDAVDAVQRYLSRLNRERLNEREVAGWPIAIVLTKCDRLLSLGLSASEWQQRIRERVGPIRQLFETRFADKAIHFGDVDVTVWPTAMRSPALAGAPVDSTGGFGIVACATHLASQAKSYRQRTDRTNHRLKLTLVGIAAILLAAFAMALVAQWMTSPERESRLVAAVHAYQVNERTTAIRLSEARRPRIKRELATLRDDGDFGNLPEDLREFVNSRLEEMGRYETYAKLFRRPSPADCRSLKDVQQLVQELKTTLAPPAEDAANWSETEAVRLRMKWAQDIDLLTEAESRIYTWSRDLTRAANEYYLKNPGSSGWSEGVANAIRAADTPPFKVEESVPGSVELPVLGGERLTYATAFEFDRIEAARRDWEFSRDRLARLRDFADALGLIRTPTTKLTSLFVWSDAPREKDALLRYATEKRARLQEFLPAIVSQPQLFSASQWPDSARDDILNRLHQSLDALASRLRELIRLAVLEAGMGDETPAAWKQVSTTFLEEPGVRDVGKLLTLLLILRDEPAVDPVAELISLVNRPSTKVDAVVLEITIPYSNPDSRFRGDSELTLSWGDQKKAARRIGEPKIDPTYQTYRFAVEPFEIRAGEPLTLTLKGTVAGVAHELIWNRQRSRLAPTDTIHQEPRLTAVNGRIELLRGVVIRTVPDSAWPSTPLLLPDLGTKRGSKP